MKKKFFLCSLIIMVFMMPVLSQASLPYILWDFEEENADENWSLHLSDTQDWENYFSFSVKNEMGNKFGAFKFHNPEKNMVIRFKRNFDNEVEIPSDGFAVLSCRVKLSGDKIGTYQLRAYNASNKQEILMGFGKKVSIYENHNPVKLDDLPYCTGDSWHTVEIIFSGKDKAMLHYFDGKPVCGEWIPLYTNSDNSQFAGPYRNLQIVSYAENSTGSQEFLIDDIAFSVNPESKLVKTTPTDENTSVKPLQPITFTFNGYIDEKTLNQANATINGEDAEITIDDKDRKTCVVIPRRKLLSDTQYSVNIDGLKDVSGSDLSANINFKTDNSVYVKDLTIKEADANGNLRDITDASLFGGDITAEILLGNDTGKSAGAIAVFALYSDNGKLMKFSDAKVHKVSSEETEKKITAEFNISYQDAQRYKLKLFVINEADISPLMNVWKSRKAYFVSPYGSDENSGEIDSPYKSLARAVSTASSGDLIVFEDGEYEESEIVSFRSRGKENSPITITARNKGKAKIIFKSSQNERLKKREKINIPKTSGYVSIKDMILTQDEAATENDNTTIDIFINCRADNCTFSGNEIYNCYEEPIKAAGVSNILIENNVLHSSVHEGIDFVNVSDSVIRGNTLSEIERIAVMVKGGSRNIKVYNNTVFSNQRPMDVALSIGGSTDNYSGLGSSEGFFEGYNQYFWNNVVYVSGQGSINDGILFEGSKDSMAFNNTISGCLYGIRLTNAPGVVNGWEWNPTNVNSQIYNNLIMDAKAYGVYQTSSADKLRSDYNMFYNCASASKSDGENSFAINDPQKVYAPDSDFRIKHGNPASGAGVILSRYVTGYRGTDLQLDLTDKDGVNRGTSWAIGAYQPIE